MRLPPVEFCIIRRYCKKPKIRKGYFPAARIQCVANRNADLYLICDHRKCFVDRRRRLVSYNSHRIGNWHTPPQHPRDHIDGVGKEIYELALGFRVLVPKDAPRYEKGGGNKSWYGDPF